MRVVVFGSVHDYSLLGPLVSLGFPLRLTESEWRHLQPTIASRHLQSLYYAYYRKLRMMQFCKIDPEGPVRNSGNVRGRG